MLSPKSHLATTAIRSESLSTPRQHLIRLLDHIYYGRFLDLHVRGGEPVFDDQTCGPRLVRTVKLSGTSQPRPRLVFDPLQKREIADLLRLLDEVGDGVVGRIEIAHGIPLFAEVHESVA